MLLATDLDGTFLGGKSLHKQQLYRLIKKNTAITLVFVTGRGLESVIPLLNDPVIPNPDYIICDVGATVVNGHTLEPVQFIQNDIEKNWPGILTIRETMKDIEGLQYQEVPQQRRCSFFANLDAIGLEHVQAKAHSIHCEVVYSANRFLDILPMGVNKGTTLVKLVGFLRAKSGDILVAGDTLNDLSLFECGYKGVVVGDAEPLLLESTANMQHVFQAELVGAGGILEAIRKLRAFSHYVSDFDKQVEYLPQQEAPQLIMMYHRFPYETKEVNGIRQRVTPKSPNGILPTLQSFFSDGRSGVWIAWEEVANSGELLRNIYPDKEKYPNLMASRIGLTKKEIEIFYKSFAKEAFWPAIFSFIDKVVINHHHWDYFVRINRLFAIKASEQADVAAIVWIHDYNLWLVPGMLRELRPDLKIAFFHHTAFPAANTFNILPWRRDIISSLLQCDYIGFHIPRYVENFVDVVKSLYPIEVLEEINCAPRFLTYSTALGVKKMTTQIGNDRRKIKLGANPVGINVNYITGLMQEEEMQKRIGQMQKQFCDKKVILSVERLDYVKGPLEKVLAFEQFLDSYPEFHGKIELLQICTPPAIGMKIYDKVQHDLEHAVGRINGRYSSIDWIPIRLFSRSFPFDELVAYYAVADIAWITPLRDGLNLVAKEYVAVQGQISGSTGVLILSEFAGAAVEMDYALLTNPYDPKSLKDILLQALTMSEADKSMRIKRLYEMVHYYDVDRWATDFLKNLAEEEEHTIKTELLSGTVYK